MSHIQAVARAATSEARFRLIDPLQPESGQFWDALAISDANATLFHTSAWAKVLAETYRYRPAYMIIHGRSGEKMLFPMMEVRSVITGIRGTSLPFTDFCEPLTLGGQDLVDMPEEIRDYARSRRWKSIEIRGGENISSIPSASFYTHSLCLRPNTEEMFAGLTGSTRRNIKKATREHVEIKISASEEAVKRFYRLHCMTRKKHGIPPQPYSFFRSIHRHVIGEDKGFVVLGSKAGVDIAGAIYFGLGRRAVYKFGASDYSYQHLRANSLVMWEAIKKLVTNGYQRLCFGRTDLHHDGLRRFKMGFGAEERLVHYHKLDMRTLAFVEASASESRSYEAIFRAMPTPLLRMVGALLYRHVG